MWATILFLVLLFVAGFISTNFPRKKLLAWFQSLWVEIRDPSGVAPATKYQTLPVPDGQRKAVKTSDKVQLRGVFATFDKNNDGYITKQELRDSLRNIGMAMSEKDVDDMIRRVDSNGDGLIDLDEFCESFDSLLGRGETNKEEPERDGDGDGADEAEADGDDGDLKEAFDVFDGDKDGVITVEELGLVLSSLGFKEGRKLEDCKEMIRKVDMDGDGMVNFEEFKKMMKAGHRLVPIS